jgi:hypothetical protein
MRGFGSFPSQTTLGTLSTTLRLVDFRLRSLCGKQCLGLLLFVNSCWQAVFVSLPKGGSPVSPLLLTREAFEIPVVDRDGSEVYSIPVATNLKNVNTVWTYPRLLTSPCFRQGSTLLGAPNSSG